MTLLRNGRCPRCKGPITFLEVMSILTPYQAIDCTTCGSLVFLKHKLRLSLILIGLGAAVFLFALFALALDLVPVPLILAAGIGFLVATELVLVFHIIRTNGLVVRADD